MKINVGITDDGVITYPPHKHDTLEIMTYLTGTGYLYTPEMNYPFEPGTVILVPPGIMHGSVSERGFKNISIGGNFDELLVSENPISVQDSKDFTATALAKMIYGNCYASEDFLSELCHAFLYFLLQRMNFGNNAYTAISKIIKDIKRDAFDNNISLNNILNQSSYSEDYIRAQFRRFTGKTPTAFLTEIRINRARFLIDVYGESLSLQEVALKCGFCDYVYFSKQFKRICSLSPTEYRKSKSQKNA